MTTKRRALRNRLEIITDSIWGRYELPETFMNNGTTPAAPFYCALNPKSSGLVRLEWGFGRRGYYLSWGINF